MMRNILILSISVTFTLAGCGSDDSGHTHGEDADHTHEQAETQQAAGETHTHGEGEEEEEHTHPGDSTHSHEGEENVTQLEPDETYNAVRRGVRLVLSYNSETDSFTGTVENTTEEALPGVQVIVQLSNGSELGSTTPVDLDSGEKQSVALDAGGVTFDNWTAHSAIGNNEHSHGGESDHEH